MKKVWIVQKNCNCFYSKVTQHLTYYESYSEVELYLFVHLKLEIWKICTISCIPKQEMALVSILNYERFPLTLNFKNWIGFNFLY